MTLLSVTVLTLDSKDVPVLGSIREGMMSALSPVESAARTVATPFRNAWNGISDYDDLEAENQELREQLDALKGRELNTESFEEEVKKLREQLNVPFVTGFDVEVAQIATGNFSSFDDFTARIDKGSDHGVQVGMPVVTSAGLIGNIERVSPDRSVVHLITDPDFGVGVRLKSNAFGVGRGSGPKSPFIVDRGIGLDVEVAEGDPVSTSGQERAKFPKELPIGTVSKITRSQSDQTQILEVDLAADLGRLDYVQVLECLPRDVGETDAGGVPPC
ncbi:MAG TPA: rod shape-determining protein MreC [Microthrixaceae bacterium]|nr:rod shape-determining protein MreC [Microthrixaceae bacterium]